MKRYRLMRICFDSRPSILAQEISDNWAEEARRLWEENQRRSAEDLLHEFGDHHGEAKLKNLVDLGNKPFTIPGYHHLLLEQIRRAFVCFGYYPALTGACVLGERILNHLMLQLREDFRHTPEYPRVSRKSSFDNWNVPIPVLASWGVLLPEVVPPFHELRVLRNSAIHFSEGLEEDTRTPALRSIELITSIIARQFSACGSQPWFIPISNGEVYIKKEAEKWPFVREFYLPACAYVGPRHRIAEITPQMEFKIVDDSDYGLDEVTDEEFMELRKASREER